MVFSGECLAGRRQQHSHTNTNPQKILESIHVWSVNQNKVFYGEKLSEYYFESKPLKKTNGYFHEKFAFLSILSKQLAALTSDTNTPKSDKLFMH